MPITIVKIFVDITFYCSLMEQNNLVFLKQPLTQLVWQSYRRVPNLVLIPEWRRWILDTGSLTKRLIAISANHFRVEVLHQSVSTPVNNERHALNMKTRQMCLIREVALQCHQLPVVYARSVIPLTTLRGQERQLAYLGNKPLGAFLFQHHNMSRGPLEITTFSHLLSGDDRFGWARRSVFYLNNRPLLVSEFFLPNLIRLSKQTDTRSTR